MKKLYKSTRDRMICGVCGGIAEYMQVDPTLVRLAAVVLGFTGSGLLIYIVAAIIMPDDINVK